MPLWMIHSYTGELIACAEFDGEQHTHRGERPLFRVDECDRCGDVVLSCHECEVNVSCCLCGAYHALACPWPI